MIGVGCKHGTVGDCQLCAQEDREHDTVMANSTEQNMERIESPKPCIQVQKAMESSALRFMFLRNLALNGSLEAFVACNQLDHMHDMDKLEAFIDKAMREGWK